MSLHVDGQEIMDHEAMSEAVYDHFAAALGTSDPRAFTLNLDGLDPRSFDLAGLDVPFFEDKIWAAVK